MFKVHRSFNLSQGVKNASIAVTRHGSDISVVYHRTQVVHVSGDVVELNNGGWDTVSTRMVINRALECLNANAALYRKKGVTMLSHPDGTESEFMGSATILVTRSVAA